MKEDKKYLPLAKFLSGFFNPFIIPFVGFLFLFLFTYLNIMPFQYKLIILGIVYSFTILMPLIFIWVFRKMNGETPEAQRNIIPHIFTLIAYTFCLGLLYKLQLPSYMSGIILASLIALAVCFIINLKWNISEHMVGMGGIIGSLVAFGYLFFYNPVGWLCVFILIAGAVGTARIILAKHTLLQIITGFALGFGSALFGILY